MKHSGGSWPLIITLLAALLRWQDLDAARLTWDHAYPVAQAQLLLSRGDWPALGQPTTFLFSNPPGQAYLSLVPLALFNSQWGVLWWMSALNILAVPLVYHLGRKFFGEATGWAAALLLAVNPWVVQYSRASWAQALAPLATAFILFSLMRGAYGHSTPPKSRFVFAGFAALTAFTQTYLLALLIMPIQAGLVLLTRFKRLPRQAVLAGSILWALCAAIFALNIWRDWPMQSARLSSFTEAESQSEFKVQAFQLASRYVTGLDYPVPDVSGGWVTRIISLFAQGSAWALTAVLAFGIGLGVKNIFSRKPDALPGAALLLWWLTPVAILSFNNHPLHDWHLILSLPAGHVLAGRSLGKWLGGRVGRVVVTVALAVTSFAVLHANHINNNSYPIGDELDQTTLGASRLLGDTIRRLTDENDVAEIFAVMPEASVIAWSAKPLANVSWFIDPALIIAPLDRAAVYMRLGKGRLPPPLPLARRAEVFTFPGESVVAFDVIPAMDRAAMQSLSQTRVDWPSDTGLTLLGYSLDGDLRPGGTANIATYWLIETLAETRSSFIYGPYLHLNAADGATLVNINAPGLPGYHYRLGDLYIQPLTFTLPDNISAGEYQLELGLYDGLHGVGTTFFPPDEAPRPFYTVSLTLSK